MKDFFQDTMTLIRKAVDEQFGGNVAKASKSWGVTGDNLHKWLRGDRIPTLEKISPIMNQLGIGLNEPGEACRDVCFVNSRIVPAGEHSTHPDAEDYIAAPMVGEVGAGPGYIPEEEIKSWLLVYKHQDAVRYRRNLLAVEIGKNSTSMQPTLNPRDIVLVDRDDRDASKPGHMMLVLDPVDGSGMIKRVSVREKEDGDFQITYYSDNAAQNPPDVYSLHKDFDGDWEKAIVGRVVWAWSDVSNK